MEWLPLAIIGILIIILGVYFIVKWAVKDALKEYFNYKENNKSYVVKEEYTMNIGFWLCGVLVIPFVIIGVLFAIFKEKAAKFVSGFNSLPKEEQALYDKAHISRDIKNQCFTWAGIMLIGAVLSYFLTSYMAIPAFIVWFILFFKEVHFDTHKAFEKYLLK